MGRKVNISHVDRNAEIVRLYDQEKVCLEDIGNFFGLSRARLRMILGEHGVALGQTKIRRPGIDRREPTDVGLAIARRLHADKNQRNTSNAEYGLLIGLSEPKVIEALRGSYNWCLVEMVRVAGLLDITIAEFVNCPITNFGSREQFRSQSTALLQWSNKNRFPQQG